MNDKLKNLKIKINRGEYDWNKAVKITANKILDYPQALAWK